MSKVRKCVNGLHAMGTFCVASIGVVGATALGVIINVANKGFHCLPSPPVDLDVVFNAKHFNPTSFIDKVMAHDPNISLPINADIDFAGTGDCVGEVVKNTLWISVPIITTYAAICIAKGISDCSKTSTRDFQRLDEESAMQGFDSKDERRCCKSLF